MTSGKTKQNFEFPTRDKIIMQEVTQKGLSALHHHLAKVLTISKTYSILNINKKNNRILQSGISMKITFT